MFQYAQKRKESGESIIHYLSEQFLNLSVVMDIGFYFQPIILPVAIEVRKFVINEGKKGGNLLHKFGVALGLLLPICPELQRFSACDFYYI